MSATEPTIESIIKTQFNGVPFTYQQLIHLAGSEEQKIQWAREFIKLQTTGNLIIIKNISGEALYNYRADLWYVVDDYDNIIEGPLPLDEAEDSLARCCNEDIDAYLSQADFAINWNCRTNNEEPDWKEYSELILKAGKQKTAYSSACDRDKDMCSLYAKKNDGTQERIHDFPIGYMDKDTLKAECKQIAKRSRCKLVTG